MPLCAALVEPEIFICAALMVAVSILCDADAGLFYRHRNVLLKLRRDEVRAVGRKYEREMQRASVDLGLRKKSSELSVQVTTTSLLTEAVSHRTCSE